ncbi:NERD domain-containing protein [Bacillus sp. ISL-47]|uniref:nuclease-related domain-containing protein n=1 Tax=Bacillus sp. ISL-47 TaxID=2819130 RepID=UPI001BEC2D60|nr:nuclease-related domain-containing protein [Bacillus sp. ISL-47]MBT2689049.1 NERD domain-containing protein [Bacillus sp. ISL-47]MBT2708504.1 NERD domain-containing protein [Pseudomonas sp. ISL-84]
MKGMMHVILKERKTSDFILSMDALLRRLLGAHPKRVMIENDLAKRKAGDRGEEAVDYFLKDLTEFTVIHDLRLANGNDSFFQMDTLLLSSSFILILEIKNISGTIYFDPAFNQLIQTKQENERGFLDPLIQARRQQRELAKWLYDVKISIPVEYLIVISNPSTVIKTSSYHKNALDRVLHASQIPERIERMKVKYTQEVLSAKELRKLSRILVKKHCPANYNVLSYYGIQEKEVITGIQCPSCSRFSMKRARGTWKCLACSSVDKTAHVKALQDYFSPTYPLKILLKSC